MKRYLLKIIDRDIWEMTQNLNYTISLALVAPSVFAKRIQLLKRKIAAAKKYQDRISKI